jgi:hypothetical protein
MEASSLLKIVARDVRKDYDKKPGEVAARDKTVVLPGGVFSLSRRSRFGGSRHTVRTAVNQAPRACFKNLIF